MARKRNATSTSAAPGVSVASATNQATTQSNSSSQSRGNSPARHSAAELQAWLHSQAILDNIKKGKAKSFRDQNGTLYYLIGNEIVPLNDDPENYPLIKLFQKQLLPGLASPAAKYTLVWLRTAAHESASKVQARNVSTISDDRKRIYVATNDGKLLLIAREGIKTGIPQVDNVDNVLLLQSPSRVGLKPFRFILGDPKPGLQLYEELVIGSQAMRQRELAWLFGMQENLLPPERRMLQDRFLPHRKGDKGSGKSTGSRASSRINGWDDVQGDYSEAGFSAAGDCALFPFDNLENKFMPPGIQRALLSASTGGGRGRSSKDGELRKRNSDRPIVSLTAINVPNLPELRDRTISAEYDATLYGRKDFSPTELLTAIDKNRDAILSSLLQVLPKFLARLEDGGLKQIPSEWIPDNAQRFQDNYRICCLLLLSFAELAGKPRGWAEGIIQAWRTIIDSQETGSASELDSYVEDVVESLMNELAASASVKNLQLSNGFKLYRDVEIDGETGDLGIISATALLTELGRRAKPGSSWLPENAEALGLALGKMQLSNFLIVRDKDVEEPRVRNLLKRKRTGRVIGFFRVPGDDGVEPVLDELVQRSS